MVAVLNHLIVHCSLSLCAKRFCCVIIKPAGRRQIRNFRAKRDCIGWREKKQRDYLTGRRQSLQSEENYNSRPLVGKKPGSLFFREQRPTVNPREMKALSKAPRFDSRRPTTLRPFMPTSYSAKSCWTSINQSALTVG